MPKNLSQISYQKKVKEGLTYDNRSDQEQGRIDKWEAYIRENNNKKGLAGTFIDEPVDCFHVLLTNGVNKLKVDTKNIFKRLLIRHKKQNKP